MHVCLCVHPVFFKPNLGLNFRISLKFPPYRNCPQFPILNFEEILFNSYKLFHVINRAFCVGSKDMNTRIYGTEPYNNLIVYSIGGHADAIVGAFFVKDSLNVSLFPKLISGIILVVMDNISD